MHAGGERTIMLDGKNIAGVRQVKFLGSQITEDNESGEDGNKRLAKSGTRTIRTNNMETEENTETPF